MAGICEDFEFLHTIKSGDDEKISTVSQRRLCTQSVTTCKSSEEIKAHPTHRLLIIPAGCLIKLWYWDQDYQTLLDMNDRVLDVSVQSFGRYMIALGSETISLWDLQNNTLQKSIYKVELPPSNVTGMSGRIAIGQDQFSNFAVSIVGDAVSSLHVWDWTKHFQLLYSCRLGNSTPIIRLMFYSKANGGNNEGKFVVLTACDLQIWRLSYDTVPQCIATVVCSPLQKHGYFVDACLYPFNSTVYILSASGRLLMMDSCGKIVVTCELGVQSSLDESGPTFRALAAHGKWLYAGDTSGTVHVLNRERLKEEFSLPYQSSIRERVTIGTQRRIAKHTQQYAVNQIVAIDNQYTVCTYEDSCIHLLDLIGSQIVRHRFSAHGCVTAIGFDPRAKCSILAASTDTNLYAWTTGDVDRSPSFVVSYSELDDEGQTNCLSRVNKGSSGQPIYITKFAYHPSDPIYACGDSSGGVMIIHSSNATVLASCYMGKESVRGLAFSHRGDYLVVSQSDGGIHVLNSRCSYQICARIQSPGALSESELLGEEPIVDRSVQLFDNRSKSRAHNQSSCGSWMDGRETSLFILHVSGDAIKQLVVSSLAFHPYLIRREATFQMRDSCVGFAIHPSQIYVCALDRSGDFYIFNVASRECRGIIRLDAAAAGCSIDSSGLYAVICMRSDRDVNRKLRLNGPSSTLALIEIGTGRRVLKYSAKRSISVYTFLPDGSALVVGFSDGNLAVLEIHDELRTNQQFVLHELSKDSQFWHRFPIYLGFRSLYNASSSRNNQSRMNASVDPMSAQKLHTFDRIQMVDKKPGQIFTKFQVESSSTQETRPSFKSEKEPPIHTFKSPASMECDRDSLGSAEDAEKNEREAHVEPKKADNEPIHLRTTSGFEQALDVMYSFQCEIEMNDEFGAIKNEDEIEVVKRLDEMDEQISHQHLVTTIISQLMDDVQADFSRENQIVQSLLISIIDQVVDNLEPNSS